MIDAIRDLMSYSFMHRALLVGLMVSLCAALLGVSLVLKRYSMIGEGLSRVGFGALAAAMALGWAPLPVTVPVVVIAAFLLLRLSESSKLKGDAAIGLISTGSLAVGVIILSLTSGMNTDVCNFLFGSVLVMKQSDVVLSVILLLVVLILYVVFYRRLFAVTFDEAFARATGTKAGLYNALLALLTTITITLGMRLMGAMLISSLVVLPALTAMRLFGRYLSVTIAAAVISILCFLVGILLSFMYNLPTGASVVASNLVAFMLAASITSLKGRLAS